MDLENKILILSELINKNIQGRQGKYAFDILNDIIDSINYKDRYIQTRITKRLKIKYSDYEGFLEKATHILIALGFDRLDIFESNKEALEFIIKYRDKLKQPLTCEYLLNLQRLYKYHCEMMENKPENLKDLYNAYTEIEDTRKEQL